MLASNLYAQFSGLHQLLLVEHIKQDACFPEACCSIATGTCCLQILTQQHGHGNMSRQKMHFYLEYFHSKVPVRCIIVILVMCRVVFAIQLLWAAAFFAQIPSRISCLLPQLQVWL